MCIAENLKIRFISGFVSHLFGNVSRLLWFKAACFCVLRTNRPMNQPIKNHAYYAASNKTSNKNKTSFLIELFSKPVLEFIS